MNPKMKASDVVHKYFSTLYQVIFAILVLSFLFLFALSFNDKKEIQKNATIIAIGMFLLLCLPQTPMIVLFFRVKREIKKGAFICQTVTVRSTKIEKFYNFYNKGGVIIDDERSVLIDSTGSQYHYIGESAASNYLVGKEIKITYLQNTRFLISAELISKTADEYLLKIFSSVFVNYLDTGRIPRERDRSKHRKK